MKFSELVENLVSVLETDVQERLQNKQPGHVTEAAYGVYDINFSTKFPNWDTALSVGAAVYPGSISFRLNSPGSALAFTHITPKAKGLNAQLKELLILDFDQKENEQVIAEIKKLSQNLGVSIEPDMHVVVNNGVVTLSPGNYVR